MNRYLPALTFILTLCFPVAGAHADSADEIRARNLKTIETLHESQSKAALNNSDVLVLPGLIADRKRKTVNVYAESTGIGDAEPVEFFIIAQGSGHDYEALAVAFAKPSDIHRALVFIGVPPGKAVDPRNLRMWPKGERVFIDFNWPVPAAQGKAPTRVPVEHFLIDGRTRKSMKQEGFLFVGSQMVPSLTESNKTVYAADSVAPNSIAANYNEPTTVFDLPRQASKSEQYNHLSSNPEHAIPRGTLLQVLIRPERTDGHRRVEDLFVSVAPKGADAVAFSVRTATQKTLLRGGTLPALLATFEKIADADKDPYVTLSFGPNVTLAHTRKFCEAMTTLEGPAGVRMEPPPAGQLYYQAFVPNPEFGQRAKRFTQPWELYVELQDKGLSARLVRVEERRGEDPPWKETSYPARTAEELARTIVRVTAEQRAAGSFIPPAIVVYVPGNVTYAAFMRLIADARKTHPLIHVFLKE